MKTPKFIEVIWISIQFGLSNKKGGAWGIILLLYTVIWIIWVLFVIYMAIKDFLNGVIDVSLFLEILVYVILAPYLLIYFAWDSNDKKKNKEIQIDTQKPIDNLNKSSSRKPLGPTKEIKTVEIPPNILSIYPHAKNIINSMGNVLQNEKIVDVVSGQIKNNEKKDFNFLYIFNPLLVLTSSRIISYNKNILGGFNTNDYPINGINSIAFNSGLIFDSIKIQTKIGNLEINDIPKKVHAENFVNNLKSCMSSFESRSMTNVKTQTFNKSITRETEFYQGFIRLKISIANTTAFVINDVTLDFHFDEVLLRIDRHKPDYPIKNGKLLLGNINNGSSKSIDVYFDPMMCSRGTEINCQINYSDEKGQIQTVWMEPKMINVVCPIMKTDSDINIGRLKEFVEKLPHSDCKIYQIQTGFNIDPLKNNSREVIQKHDVKHIRTLYTKDGKTCEMWYYGNTKVNNHNIVIRITISSENKSLELFAATQTAESLTGLLAELGRELFTSIEAKITGKNNVNQVINVSIKDSIIQRSNLLSYCDINGNCTDDVVIEDSLVQRSNMEFDTHIHDNNIQKYQVNNNLCPDCGEKLPENAKFCLECGGKINQWQ